MHELQLIMRELGLQYNTTREIMIGGLVLGRMVPMIFITPFMAGQTSPPEVKMGIAVLFAIIVWPLVRDSMTAPIPMQAFPFLLLLLKETLIGFTVGFANSHIFAAMETAGRFIDTARGAALNEVLVPTSRSRATPLGTMYQQLLLIVFVGLGGHHIFFDTFFHSFATIPINVSIDLTPGWSPIAMYITWVTGQVLYIAVLMSAPAIAATFITDLVFGILNRVAPQLNAYFLSMPVKAVSGLVLVLASLQPFFSRMEYYIQQSLVAVEKTVELMTHR